MQKNNQNEWMNDVTPDLSADEKSIKNNKLAGFKHIFNFSARYWGSGWALFGSLILFLIFAALTTSETTETFIMGWLEQTKQASGLNFIVKAGAPILIVLVLLLTYRFFCRTLVDNRVFKAWALSALTLLLASVSVKLNVAFAMWSKAFYDAIQNRNEPEFWIQSSVFIALAVFWVLVGTYRQFFQQLLQIRWRTWLTQIFSNQYFDRNRFYFFAQQEQQDNPDQRIAEDLDKFTELAIYLYFGAYISVLSMYEFSKLMLDISGDINFNHFGLNFTIPDYLFWLAVIYAIAGSLFIHYVGRRLIKIEALRQRYNATFRYHLIRAREYAEGITSLQGANHHREESRRLFGIVRSNWNTRMWVLKFLGFSSLSYNQASVLFPILLMAPRYFADKAFTWGNFMQVLRTFGELRESLSWFIDNYQNIAELRGTATRIFALEDALTRIDTFNGASELTVTPNNVGGIALTHISLSRPQLNEKEQLTLVTQVSELNWQISQGDRWLITGASGSGKSTILRAIAQLWPYGKGQIDVPAKAKILFLPQRPYFPIATLREALSYPATSSIYNDAAYETVLEMSQLHHLKDRLNESANWGQILSGGEQQRLAFARVFLQRPEYLFLDEATSALDLENERSLYATLLNFMPKVTLISVSHHKQLTQYHNQNLDLTADTTDTTGGFKAKIQVI